MSADANVIAGVDLSGDRYVIRQSLIRNRYAVEDGDGSVVLRGKQKMLRVREEFPFTDPDGDVVFRLKARNVLDVAGDYALVDEASGETVAVVEKQFTLFEHVYRIRSPDGDLWATVESESAIVMALKEHVGILGLLPHSYSITGADGRSMGTVRERLSLRDTFDVEVGDTGDVPREAIVAVACAIDALEDD